MPWTSHDEDAFPFKLRRLQLPVRLAFSMIINKAQGQTFDRVGIYLPYPVFTHGQLYVAFSRVRDSDSIRVQLDSKANNQTRNVIYEEIL